MRNISLAMGAAFFALFARAESSAPEFSKVAISTNREVSLQIQPPAGAVYRVDLSPDLARWSGWSTFLGPGTWQQNDPASSWLPARFYRVQAVAETNALTGDHFDTSDGELTVHPVNHASFVMSWKEKIIYCDPVGGSSLYKGLPRAGLVLITHAHSDHFDANTITAVRGTNALVITPSAVYQQLPAALKSGAAIMANVTRTNWMDIAVEAVPAYNLTSTFHPKGAGNGYVLTIGGKRIYVSGDTEDTPELRALTGIDVAFVCMNLPYTMTVEKAASAVRQFKPAAVYPYHYRGYTAHDLDRFRSQVGTDQHIEVRLREWY